MTDETVGYKKPPASGRFKSGVSGNPRGRPKQKAPAIADIINGALNTSKRYRENGRTRHITMQELTFKSLIDRAVGGDVRAAEDILRFRMQAQRYGQSTEAYLEVEDWLPDHAGQTGEQKTKRLSDHASIPRNEHHSAPEAAPPRRGRNKSTSGAD